MSNNGFGNVNKDSANASIWSGTKYEMDTQYSRPDEMNPSAGDINALAFLTSPGIYVNATYNNCERGLLAIRHRKRNAPHREGIGLYTHEQEKNATPYGYFAQIVVGVIIAILGFVTLANQIALRGEEIRKYGSAETDVRGWIGSLAFIVLVRSRDGTRL